MHVTKRPKITALLVVAMLLAWSPDVWAVEFLRIRPRRVVVNQGDGAVLTVITRAVPPASGRDRFIVLNDIRGLPPQATGFFFPDFLFFPDRGRLFISTSLNTPVGTYTLLMAGDVYNFQGEFIRTIFSDHTILEVRPPVSPTGPNVLANKRR